jgi:hypothetical protein
MGIEYFVMYRVNFVLGRRLVSTTELAKILRTVHPQEDPRVLKESKVKLFASSVMKSRFPESGSATSVNVRELHEKWKTLFEKDAHETAYEEAADPGEQCDGELNSWRNDRLRAEEDRNYKVPQVSAHEAATRLKQGPHK